MFDYFLGMQNAPILWNYPLCKSLLIIIIIIIIII